MAIATFNSENVVLENVKLIKLGFITRGENRTSFRIVFFTPENKESSLIVESLTNSELTTSNADLVSIFNFYLSKKNASLLSSCDQVNDLKRGFILIDKDTSEIIAIIKGHCYLNKNVK